MDRKKYILSIVVLCIVTMVIALLLVRSKPETVQPQEATLELAVSTGKVHVGDLQTTVREQGRLVPASEARLLFQVEGPIVQRHVVPGQKVDVGAALLDIEDSRQQAAVQRAEASLNASLLAAERDRGLLALMQQRVELLQQEVQRQRELQRDALSSLERLQQAERELIAAEVEQQRLQHEVKVATENEKRLRADLASARRQLAHCHIVAPFAGQVNQVAVQLGDNAIPGQLAVHLVSADNMDVLLAVSGKDVRGLALGSAAKIILPDGLQQQRLQTSATIREIQLVPDERTYTHLLRLRLADSSNLLAGQVVEVILPGQTLQDVLLVPYGALWQQQGQHYLYTVDADNRLQQQAVRVLQSTSSKSAVQGVAEGQEIVLDATPSMLPGQGIQRINPEP